MWDSRYLFAEVIGSPPANHDRYSYVQEEATDHEDVEAFLRHNIVLDISDVEHDKGKLGSTEHTKAYHDTFDKVEATRDVTSGHGGRPKLIHHHGNVENYDLVNHGGEDIRFDDKLCLLVFCGGPKLLIYMRFLKILEYKASLV